MVWLKRPEMTLRVWKIINRVLERNSGGKSIPSLNENGKVAIEDGKLAEALNMHFVSVGPKLAENIASKQSDNLFKYIKSNDSASLVLKSVNSSHILKCFNATQKWQSMRA